MMIILFLFSRCRRRISGTKGRPCQRVDAGLAVAGGWLVGFSRILWAFPKWVGS